MFPDREIRPGCGRAFCLITKRLLSVVPAPTEFEEGIKSTSRALPIEVVELSRGPDYGY